MQASLGNGGQPRHESLLRLEHCSGPGTWRKGQRRSARNFRLVGRPSSSAYLALSQAGVCAGSAASGVRAESSFCLGVDIKEYTNSDVPLKLLS